MPATVFFRPGFGSGRLLPRSGSVARVFAAPWRRAGRGFGSGPIVPEARIRGTHGPNSPDRGVPMLVTPRSAGEPKKGGRTGLPPQPGLLCNRFSLLCPLLELLRRPSRAAAPLPPVATATNAGRAAPAAVPTCGTTACGRRPVRAMAAAIWPPAVTRPRSPPTAARAAMAALAAGATGGPSTAPPATPRRPPVRAPRAEMPSPPTTVPPWRRWSWRLPAPSLPPFRGNRTSPAIGGCPRRRRPLPR